MQPSLYNLYAPQPTPPTPVSPHSPGDYVNASVNQYGNQPSNYPCTTFFSPMQSPPPMTQYVRLPAAPGGFPRSRMYYGIPPQTLPINHEPNARPAVFRFGPPPQPSHGQLPYPSPPEYGFMQCWAAAGQSPRSYRQHPAVHNIAAASTQPRVSNPKIRRRERKVLPIVNPTTGAVVNPLTESNIGGVSCDGVDNSVESLCDGSVDRVPDFEKSNAIAFNVRHTLLENAVKEFSFCNLSGETTHDVTLLEDQDVSVDCLKFAEPRNSDESSLMAEIAEQDKSATLSEVLPAAVEQVPHLVSENTYIESSDVDAVLCDKVIPDIQDRSNALSSLAVDQRSSLLFLREQPLLYTTSMSETRGTSTATSDVSIVENSDNGHRDEVMTTSELEDKEDELSEDVFGSDAGSPVPGNEQFSFGIERSTSTLGSIAEESAVEPVPRAGVGDDRRLITENLNADDKLLGFVAGLASGNENGGRHRSRRSSKDGRSEGPGSRECSYSRGSSTEPPSPSIIESSRRTVPRSASSSVLSSQSKNDSLFRDSSQLTEFSRNSRTSLSQSDLTGNRQPLSPVRYDRNYLLQLQFAPESLQKPSGLPVLPEIILNAPSVRQHQLPAGSAAAVTSPRCHPNAGGPNLSSRKSVSDFTPVFMRSLSGGAAGNSIGNGPSRSQGRRGSAAPTPASPVPRKVIQVALQQPVQLHTTENAWKPAALKHEKTAIEEHTQSEDMYRKLRGILNKLTPQKFEKLSQQVLDLKIDTEERLKGCIDIIFEKAVDEPQFAFAYANLAKNMIHLKVPTEHNCCESVTFRKLLLNQCQREFEKDKADETDIERLQAAIDSCTSEDQKKQLIEEREQAEFKSRRRSLGNIRFIGELFKLKMLTENIMRDCVSRLLRASDDESLECLCRLLTTIGKDLDDKCRDSVNTYFQRISDMLRKHKMSNRIRFMLQDVVDLRNNDWVPRREDNKPKTIDQIHLDAVAEQHKTTALLRVQSTPAMLDQHGRHRAGTADNWKSPGNAVETQRTRRSRPTHEDPNQLGPNGARNAYPQWPGNGTGVSSRTASTDRDQPQARLQLDNKMDVTPIMSSRPSRDLNSETMISCQSSRAGRELAMETMTRDRNAALAAVRNIVGGARSINNDTSHTSPILLDNALLTDCRAPVVSISDELKSELDRKTIAILKEFLDLKDFKEAIICVRELNAPTYMTELVRQTINHVLEWSSDARCLCGQLLRRLIECKLIAPDQYVTGLKDILVTVEDMEIDIPKIWQYLAEILSPMVQNDEVLSLRFLRTIFEPLKQNPRIGDVIVHILKDAIKRLEPPVVAKLWHESRLDWSYFVPDVSIDPFLKKNDLAWIQTPSLLPLLVSASGEADWLQEQLAQLILKCSVNNEAVLLWIEDHRHAVDIQSSRFIRTLMNVVCCSAIKVDDGVKYRVDVDVIKSRGVLLHKYLDHSVKRELHALYALQLLIHRLQHPPKLLLGFFEVLYDEEIISEDAFYEWLNSEDTAEHPGKGIACASVSQFYTWLREANSAPDDT